MKYVFPEYKENVVLGNGKLQLNPMSYQVIYEGKDIDLQILLERYAYSEISGTFILI